MKKADLIKKSVEELADLVIEISNNQKSETKKLSEELDASSKDLEKLNKENEELKSYIAEQNAKISDQEKSLARKIKVIGIDDKKYKMPFTKVNYNGNILTIEQLLADEKLAKEVRDASLGILEEIKE